MLQPHLQLHADNAAAVLEAPSSISLAPKNKGLNPCQSPCRKPDNRLSPLQFAARFPGMVKRRNRSEKQTPAEV